MISEETRKLIEENEELVEKNLKRWIAGCKKRMAVFSGCLFVYPYGMYGFV